MVEDYRFEVFVDEATNGKQYVVKYYDFESVIGVGDTVEEAIADGRGNLEFYIKYCIENNIKYPSPSKHEDIDYSGKVTLRLPKSLHKLAAKMAVKEGVSLNALLSDAVANYVYSNSAINKIAIDTADGIAKVAQNLVDRAYDYAIDQSVKKNEVSGYKYHTNNFVV